MSRVKFMFFESQPNEDILNHENRHEWGYSLLQQEFMCNTVIFVGYCDFLKAQFTLKNDQIKLLLSNTVWLFLSVFFPYNETE